MAEESVAGTPESPAWRDWTSGLFVFTPYGEPMVGRARIHGDVIGQVAAAITCLRPDGVGSAYSDWHADTFLLVDLLESRLLGVIDQRGDTGELSVELTVILPEGTAAPWTSLEDYSPAEVFSALGSIAADWEFRPATSEALEEVYEPDSDDLAVALEALAEVGAWQPVEWDV